MPVSALGYPVTCMMQGTSFSNDEAVALVAFWLTVPDYHSHESRWHWDGQKLNSETRWKTAIINRIMMNRAQL